MSHINYRDSEKSKRSKTMDYVKANRKGSRDAELDDEFGWVSKSKIHKTKREYNRNKKYKDLDY